MIAVVWSPRPRMASAHGPRAVRRAAGLLEQLVERDARAVAERGHEQLERPPQLLEIDVLDARAGVLERLRGAVARVAQLAPGGHERGAVGEQDAHAAQVDGRGVAELALDAARVLAVPARR